MQRIFRGLALAALAAIASPAHAGTDAIKIGVLTDMAGVTADITGKGSVTAAEMAVEEFGGTVLGKKIQVLFADHQHKVDVGSALTRQWFDIDKVDTIVDVPNSGVALAVQTLAREKQKIVMFSGAGTTALTNDACSPYGFHWTYDTYGLSHGTASAVVKSGGKTWVILAADYAFGQQWQKDTTDVVLAAGGKVVGAVRHPLNNADFSAYLVQAQASGAQVIGIANAGNDTVNAIKQAQEFGLVDQNHSLAALILMLQDVHSLGLKAAQGTYLTTASYWDVDDASRAWSKRFFARTNMMPSMIHAGVYALPQSHPGRRHRQRGQGGRRDACHADQRRLHPQRLDPRRWPCHARHVSRPGEKAVRVESPLGLLRNRAHHPGSRSRVAAV